MVTDNDGEHGGTRVDLGDDLVERTAVTPGLEPVARVIDIDDQLHSATILMNEGMFEDAKRILRRILIVDSHHVVARQTLDEIHALELKQIFGEDRRHRMREKPAVEERAVDSEAVMRKLDQDLQLGVFDDGDRGESLGAAMALFQNPGAMRTFEVNVDQLMRGAGARDRIDLGIAFLEMGLYDIAVRLFRVAAHDAEYVLSATSLLAYALILGGRPFEAIMCIEPILTDSDVGKEDRVEFLYLLGRANEGLRKREESLLWYTRVREIDSYYRDVIERMRVLSEKPPNQR